MFNYEDRFRFKNQVRFKLIDTNGSNLKWAGSGSSGSTTNQGSDSTTKTGSGSTTKSGST